MYNNRAYEQLSSTYVTCANSIEQGPPIGYPHEGNVVGTSQVPPMPPSIRKTSIPLYSNAIQDLHNLILCLMATEVVHQVVLGQYLQLIIISLEH